MKLKPLQLILGICLTAAPLTAMAQAEFTVVESAPANPDNEPLPVHPVPHERQILWNETEFYAFFHYGINTYTNKEWGYGDENPSLFAPTAVPNPKQWLEAAKSAGMKGGIAVVKHHDGFCLWPTATTTHNVTASSNANAQKTNIPKDFAAAAKELDMKYGFYVSPWDRNSGYYGDGTNNYVEKLFIPQCAELAAYGSDQFEMWFDGANGGDGYYGGARTTRSIDASTYYDIPNLRHQVHELCPNCVMWGVGDEARWIGNEAGWAGETNWQTQNRGRGAGANTEGAENGWVWLPGESDAKATSHGWFWHNGETVHSAERLFQMYLETVGRNATLILNLPPRPERFTAPGYCKPYEGARRYAFVTLCKRPCKNCNRNSERHTHCGSRAQLCCHQHKRRQQGYILGCERRHNQRNNNICLGHPADSALCIDDGVHQTRTACKEFHHRDIGRWRNLDKTWR